MGKWLVANWGKWLVVVMFAVAIVGEQFMVFKSDCKLACLEAGAEACAFVRGDCFCIASGVVTPQAVWP